MSHASSSEAGEKFQRLVEVMARLRSPDGCPWDREQDFDSIKAYLLEETYEVMDAIDARDWRHLADELGDLMLQAVFFAQMASEQNRFRIEDSLDAIVNKLVRRHPHVFGSGDARTPDEVKRRWDEIKSEEKREKNGEKREAGLLDGVSRKAPALAEAEQLTSRASTVGFDWQNADQVLEKLDEELEELAEARRTGDRTEIGREVGDLLFVLANLARLLKVDAEQALRGTNAKFRRRFGYLERRLSERGTSLTDATLAQMDSLWQEAKEVT